MRSGRGRLPQRPPAPFFRPDGPDPAMPRPDLQTERDVRLIVDTFYEDIEHDPWLGRFFEGLDMPAHLPKMYAFWSSVVFQTGTYPGRPFDAHLRLDGLTDYHFTR